MLQISGTGREHVRADLGGVHVVVHEGIDDGGQLGLDDEVAGVLEVRDEGAESFADLRETGTLNLTYWSYLKLLTPLIASTISCSVVSLVMKSSRSRMMSRQMLQVSSLRGRTRAEATRTSEARTRRTWRIKILDCHYVRWES